MHCHCSLNQSFELSQPSLPLASSSNLFLPSLPFSSIYLLPCSIYLFLYHNSPSFLLFSFCTCLLLHASLNFRHFLSLIHLPPPLSPYLSLVNVPPPPSLSPSLATCILSPSFTCLFLLLLHLTSPSVGYSSPSISLPFFS